MRIGECPAHRRRLVERQFATIPRYMDPGVAGVIANNYTQRRKVQKACRQAIKPAVL